MTVRVSLKSDWRSRTVFEEEITIGARASVRARKMVTATPTDTYTVTLHKGDTRLGHDSVYSMFTSDRSRPRLFLINDGPSFSGIAAVKQSAALTARVDGVGVPADGAPHHWAAYDHVRAVGM